MSADLTLLVTGDIHVQRPDPYSAFASCRDLLHAADITYGNLECSIIDRERIPGGPPPGPEPRSDERVLAAYVDAGFDVVSLANNAAMYMGLAGIGRTMELLDAAGIRHCGASSRNDEEAWRPLFVEKNGVRIAFISYTSVYRAGTEATPKSGGVAVVRVDTAFEVEHPQYIMPGRPPKVHCIPRRADVARMTEVIRAARQQADVVIVSWHWGMHDHKVPMPPVLDYQSELGRSAIDAGADLLVGHHAHALEAIEVYRGKVIFHSLGDLVHDEMVALVGPQRKSTVVARCEIRNRRLERVALIPGRISDSQWSQPEFPPLDAAMDVVEQLRAASARFGTSIVMEDGQAVVSTA